MTVEIFQPIPTSVATTHQLSYTVRRAHLRSLERERRRFGDLEELRNLTFESLPPLCSNSFRLLVPCECARPVSCGSGPPMTLPAAPWRPGLADGIAVLVELPERADTKSIDCRGTLALASCFAWEIRFCDALSWSPHAHSGHLTKTPRPGGNVEAY